MNLIINVRNITTPTIKQQALYDALEIDGELKPSCFTEVTGDADKNK